MTDELIALANIAAAEVAGAELSSDEYDGAQLTKGHDRVVLVDDGDDPGKGFIVFTWHEYSHGWEMVGDPQFGTSTSALDIAKEWLR